MFRKKRNLLLVLLAVVVIAFLTWAVFTASRPAPLSPMPNPNGYDDLVKAGQMLSGTLDDYRKASAEQLRDYVTTNAATLKETLI